MTSGLFVGADLCDLHARINHRDQLTSLHRATGAPICFLATVVIVVELRYPRNHDIHTPALLSNRISRVPPDQWPAELLRPAYPTNDDTPASRGSAS